MIEGVVFDVDGTIVDSVSLHAKSWQIAFEKFGKEISFEAIRRQIGKGADQLLPVFFSSDELRRIGRELDEYRSQLFRAEYLPRVKPLPKVRELFERIRQDGRQIAIASSAKEEELDQYKSIAQIADLIDAEISSGDVDRSKPFPDIFESVREKLVGFGAERILAVGDTPHDAEAAIRANIPIIGVQSGGWPEASLRQAGCIEVYRDPADLLRRYDRSALRPTR